MVVVSYPSESFVEVIEALCDRGEDFDVCVNANSKTKQQILELLPIMTGQTNREPIGNVPRVFKTMDFQRAYAFVHEHKDGYEVTYEDQGDLIIHFRRV